MVRQPVDVLEVELRAKAPADIENTLRRHGAVELNKTHEHDEYFKFEKDEQRQLVLRIRTTSHGSKLTFKGSAKTVTDSAWQEWETDAANPEVLKRLLLSNGLVPVVTIDKHRTAYKAGELTINVDTIAGLGDFIEAEILTDDANEGHRLIRAFFATIGVTEIVTKGYVPLMLEKLQ